MNGGHGGPNDRVLRDFFKVGSRKIGHQANGIKREKRGVFCLKTEIKHSRSTMAGI